MSVLATARNKVKSTLTAPGRKTVDARAGGRWAVPQTQHNAQATLYEHNSIISMCNKPVVRTKREKRLYFTVQTRVNSTIYRQIGSRTHKPPNFPAACKGRCMGGRRGILSHFGSIISFIASLSRVLKNSFRRTMRDGKGCGRR